MPRVARMTRCGAAGVPSRRMGWSGPAVLPPWSYFLAQRPASKRRPLALAVALQSYCVGPLRTRSVVVALGCFWGSVAALF